MKAILCTQYGPPEALQLHDVDKPVPGDDQVLVKIFAASANILDLQMRGGLARLWSGLRKPKDPRLGRDIAGIVEATGKNVTQFHPGEEVFGVCDGAYAEYATTREQNIALKPVNCSFEEAATAPVAAITALQGLRDKGQIQAGQKVLIQGASGGVGTFAVQIAKAFGAEVTAVCSTRNLDQARALGADQVIDYTKEDFTRTGKQYDLIFAVNGYHSIFDYRHALSPKGIYLMTGAAKEHIFKALLQATIIGRLLSKKEGQTLGFMGIANINPKDMNFLKELFESGKVVAAIDRRYPLSETGKALQYLEEGHARGKVVITVVPQDDTRGSQA
jgi:NADPH:quinone reductase-like Zn-dependent oxidoreductase